MSEPLGRRALLRTGLLAAALPALAGCGFRPLYGRGGAAAGEPDVLGQLASVRVALIPERFGQLLRRALYQRMGQGIRGPASGAAVYELRLVPSLATEGVGIQQDGTATRVRYTGTANWVLVRIGPPVETLASGVERSIEAYNFPPNQFFAAESSRDAAEGRLAEMLAELVVTRVAVHFRRATAGQPALSGSAAPTPAVSASPQIDPMLTGPGGTQLMPGLNPAIR